MTMPSASESISPVEAVRHFNRFYTHQIGVLHEGILKSSFSLTEARVMFELSTRQDSTATELANTLSLDMGYLSRILRNLQKRGLIDKQPSATDGRQSILTLTEQGHSAFATLNACSRNEIEAMLHPLAPTEQTRLVKAMQTIEGLLGSPAKPEVPYILRSHQPGDMGWVIHRHGVLYAEEYGWDETFEALVANIAAQFIQDYDPKRERCWIAERDGEVVGSVFLVKQSDDVAKLRLLIVDPKARGLGIGKRLVAECIRFARQVGYSKITLWTNSTLLAARHIYENAGFRLVHEEEQHSFGSDWVAETWDLEL
ncbi:bifunctional helix-turn-helix transcriptional regulator/GNAT family N-acetyltransferase [Vacuolonema iberomarrocanum]|uniref:bifunctional helix-turn-helix transcriptional regulator/GNAT family N-acetyltransferase n=1 Tax=Vacuolonema iberomarrocanum TaxID=3454632 RepID=UPI0019F766C1|nr:MarR family transcriptional regulator [filamentous cyanobacterium LEGE 07170]